MAKITALVTGASSGIGLELARLFAADGHDLVLTARRESRLRQLAAELSETHGVEVAVVAADLAAPDAPRALHDTVEQRGLQVDALVNNAGFGSSGSFADADLDRQLEMIQVNVGALVELTGLCLPAMRRRGRGWIMNVASTAAFQPGPLMSVYFATKAFVLHFSEAIAEEVREEGVVVSAFCPGPTLTEFRAVSRGRDDLPVPAGVPDAATVAAAGYAALWRARQVFIPGVKNRLMALSVRWAPRAFVARTVHRMQQRR
ncbi:MAG TPA: SDR family oxidoreductase [Acidobacteriota bacterium]|nr:SDR family oxidoreductase [Acidobacteriota bacterium]